MNTRDLIELAWLGQSLTPEATDSHVNINA